MSERVFNLPNVITLLRLAAVPGVAWLILQQRWDAACWLFLAAAISDGIDGLLARWLKQMTQLGAALDTVADKALGVVTLVMLTQVGAIPLWVTLAILLRDSIIVLGALSYRDLAGQDAHVCGTVVAVAGVGRTGRAAVAGRLAACSVHRRLHHRRGFRRAVCVDMGC